MSTIQNVSGNVHDIQKPAKDNNPKIAALRPANKTLESDRVSFSANKEANEKVTFGEGVKLVAKGFWNKVKDIVKTVINNPIKTLGAVALTIAGLAALPLIGVSMATGTAALALGFAALAIGKTIVHTGQAIKHNNNGEYNKVREDLQKIGGDGLDLALSLPFVPKAFNQVSRHIKYNPKLLYINKEMVADLRQAKGVRDVAYSFFKGDLRVKYHQISNEMGFKVKPELVFDENIPTTIGGLYYQATGQIKINTFYLNPINRMKIKAAMKMTGKKTSVSNFSPEGFLRHELEHVRQFQDIARTENIGVAGLTKAIKRHHAERIPLMQQDLEQTRLKYETLKQVANPDIIQQAQLKELDKTLKFIDSSIKLAQQVAANPETAINTGFYQQAARQGGTIKAGTREASLAKQYLDDFVNEAQKIQNLNQRAAASGMSIGELNNEILKIYRGNIIEQEAFGAQEFFIANNIKGRPGVGAISVQEVSALS